MQYDLMKAFVYNQARRGKAFQLTEGVTAYINERLDKEAQHQIAQTEATERPADSAHSIDGTGVANNPVAN
jgi:hypothetical protein